MRELSYPTQPAVATKTPAVFLQPNDFQPLGSSYEILLLWGKSLFFVLLLTLTTLATLLLALGIVGQVQAELEENSDLPKPRQR